MPRLYRAAGMVKSYKDRTLVSGSSHNLRSALDYLSIEKHTERSKTSSLAVVYLIDFAPW